MAERKRSAKPSTTDRSDCPVLRVREVSRVFTRRSAPDVVALKAVGFEVQRGELLVLLGPSGCGKSTLLRCIAGLDRPDSGTIEMHDAVVFDRAQRIDVAPERRKLSMVFQSYALWPHMTAGQNVAYPLKSKRPYPSRSEIATRTDAALTLVGIAELRDQRPSQLSGGQQQRVALARALVTSQQLVLFDEPLSNVDARVRAQLRTDIRRLQQGFGFSAVYVTHDLEEAMELGDRICVMRSGTIEQVGTPEEIYTTPSSRYVSKFVGESNVVSGVVRADDDGHLAIDSGLGWYRLPLPEGVEIGHTVDLVVRPEDCQLVPGEPVGGGAPACTVMRRTFYGTHIRYVAESGAGPVVVRAPHTLRLDVGSTARLVVAADRVRVIAYTGTADGATPDRPGMMIDVARTP